jgi:hypothetical protein
VLFTLIRRSSHPLGLMLHASMFSLKCQQRTFMVYLRTERCLEEVESATHILCNCEAVAHIRFRHLSQFFIEPSDYYDAPIDNVLHFIRGVGLIRDNQKGKHNRSSQIAVQELVFVAHPLYIHTHTHTHSLSLSSFMHQTIYSENTLIRQHMLP